MTLKEALHQLVAMCCNPGVVFEENPDPDEGQTSDFWNARDLLNWAENESENYEKINGATGYDVVGYDVREERGGRVIFRACKGLRWNEKFSKAEVGFLPNLAGLHAWQDWAETKGDAAASTTHAILPRHPPP